MRGQLINMSMAYNIVTAKYARGDYESLKYNRLIKKIEQISNKIQSEE